MSCFPLYTIWIDIQSTNMTRTLQLRYSMYNRSTYAWMDMVLTKCLYTLCSSTTYDVETSSVHSTVRDKSAHTGHASKFVTEHQVCRPNLAVIQSWARLHHTKGRRGGERSAVVPNSMNSNAHISQPAVPILGLSVDALPPSSSPGHGLA